MAQACNPADLRVMAKVQSSMTSIYHITTAAAWSAGAAHGSYAAESLSSEGFIHCSTAEQVIATANRLFNGVAGLVLLHIDTVKVTAPIRDENVEGGAIFFPHIYGALETSAVISVHAFPARADGS